MQQTNMYRWIENVKNHKVKKAMPLLSFPGIQLSGITVKELISDSDQQAEVMKAIADRTPSLASVSLMDLSVEAECFGSPISFSDHEVPTVTKAVIHDMEEAEALKIPQIGDKRTSIYIEAIRKAATLITDRPVFAGVIGSFSLAGRLVDVTEALVYCYTDPDLMKEVLKKTTDFLISYIQAYKQAGANGVVIAEPLTGLLSPELAAEFSEPYLKKIVDETQDENFIVIYHNCGNSTIQIIDSLLAIGAKAYHFGNAIDMSEMMKHIPENILAMGNVDPAGQFKNGTPQSIRIATAEVLQKCSAHPNFVISSGCDVPPLSKWENIDAFYQTVEDFYSNQNK